MTQQHYIFLLKAIGETFYNAEEAFAALEQIKKVGLPSVITISPMSENKMKDGYTVLETC